MTDLCALWTIGVEDMGWEVGSGYLSVLFRLLVWRIWGGRSAPGISLCSLDYWCGG